VQSDDTGNQALYGHNVNRESILTGKVAIPAEAMVLVQAVSRATHTPVPDSPPPVTGKVM
jgi:lipid-binding SYLF domain-containing protein